MGWYLLIGLGTFFEGELVLIAAAVGVDQGRLNLWPVTAAALVGCFLGDWFFFEWGRHRGEAWLARKPGLAKKVAAVSEYLDRFSWLALPLLRFQIAMRMLGNFTLGTGPIPRGRYLLLNGLACALWAWFIPRLCLWFVRFTLALYETHFVN